MLRYQLGNVMVGHACPITPILSCVQAVWQGYSDHIAARCTCQQLVVQKSPQHLGMAPWPHKPQERREKAVSAPCMLLVNPLLVVINVEHATVVVSSSSAKGCCRQRKQSGPLASYSLGRACIYR